MIWMIIIVLVIISIFLLSKYASESEKNRNLKSNINKYKRGLISKNDLNKDHSIDDWIDDTYELLSGRKPRKKPNEEQILRRDVELAKAGEINVDEIGTGIYDEKVLINNMKALDRDLYFIGSHRNDQWYDIQEYLWDAEKLAQNKEIALSEWLNKHDLLVLEKIAELGNSYAGYTDGLKKYEQYRSTIDGQVDEIEYLEHLLNFYPIYYFDYYEESIENGHAPNSELRQTFRNNLYSFIIIRINMLPEDEKPGWFISANVDKRVDQYTTFTLTEHKLNKTDESNRSIIKLFKEYNLLESVVNNSNDKLLKTAFKFYQENYV